MERVRAPAARRPSVVGEVARAEMVPLKPRPPPLSLLRREGMVRMVWIGFSVCVRSKSAMLFWLPAKKCVPQGE